MATLLTPSDIQTPGVGRDPGVQASPAVIRDPRSDALAGFARNIESLAQVHANLLEKKQGAEDSVFFDDYQLEYTKRATQIESDALNSSDINDPAFVNNLNSSLSKVATETYDEVAKSKGYRPSDDARARVDHWTAQNRVDATRNAVSQANNQRVSSLVDGATSSARAVITDATSTGDLDSALTRIDEMGKNLSGVMAPDKVRTWVETHKTEAVQSVVRGLKERGELDKAQGLLDRYTGFASKQGTANGGQVVNTAKAAGVDPAVALGFDYLDGNKKGGAPKQPPAPDRFMVGDVMPPGMTEKGNIDLTKRPVVKNADGTISTVVSMSINEDGKEILIPTIVDGVKVSEKAAIDHYHATGENLGIFKDPASATAYAKQLSAGMAGIASKASAGPRTYGMPKTVIDAVDQAAGAYGLDAGLMRHIAAIESGGDPTQVNEWGFTGLYQFSKSEWDRYGRGNIKDPQDNAMAAAKMIREKVDRFAGEFGRPPTATEIYLMHQQGEAGLRAHTANPDRPAWENMLSTGEGKEKGAHWAKQAICGNIPGVGTSGAKYNECMAVTVNRVTSREFVALWADKVEGGSGSVYAVDNPAIRARVAQISAYTSALTTRLGTPPSPAEIYLADFVGVDAAVSMINAPEGSAPISDFMPQEFLKAHPEVANFTVDELHKWAGSQMQTAMQATQGELNARPVYADSSFIPLSTLHSLNSEINTQRKQDTSQTVDLVRDDVNSIRATGKGITIDPSKLALLTPAQQRDYEENRADARTYYDNTNDMLSQPNSVLDDRVLALQPKEGVGYTRSAKLAEDVQKYADAVKAAREKDPAASVLQVPSVKAAMAAQDPKDPAGSWKRIIDARLAAQTQVGIDPYARTILTKDEARRIAASILAMPSSPTDPSQIKEFGDRFIAMGKQVEANFGSYSDEVLQQIIGAYIKDEDYARKAGAFLKEVLARQEAGLRPPVAAAAAVDAVGEVVNQENALPRDDYGPGDPPAPRGYIPGGASMGPMLTPEAKQELIDRAAKATQSTPAFQSYTRQFLSNPSAPLYSTAPNYPPIEPGEEEILRQRIDDPKIVRDFVKAFGMDQVPQDLRAKAAKALAQPPSINLPRVDTTGMGGPSVHDFAIKGAREVGSADFQGSGFWSDPATGRANNGPRPVLPYNSLAIAASKTPPKASAMADFFTGPALGAFVDGVTDGSLKLGLMLTSPPGAEVMKDAVSRAQEAKLVNSEKVREMFQDAFQVDRPEDLTEAKILEAVSRDQVSKSVVKVFTFFQVLQGLFGAIGASLPENRVPESSRTPIAVLGVRG